MSGSEAAVELQDRLDGAVDEILDLLEQSAGEGVELNPLDTIVRRLQARGTSLDLSEAPPLMRMLLAGMGA